MHPYTSITQFHQEIDGGRMTCAEAVEYYLARIAAKAHLNAFIEVFADEARQRARELDAKRAAGGPLGRLFGVVVGVKDVICQKGHVVTAGSRILRGYAAPYHATAVERLLAEDAILIGNLNCDEFAMGSSNENSSYGPVLNALDESRVPGGSSGGSAVAVQAGLCLVSLGSDTGGSVRQPADFCGIMGFKPTYGRISRYGLLAYASSFDQIGIFAREASDIALMLEVMAGPDAYDSTASREPVPGYASAVNQGGPFRIAYFRQALEHPALDLEIKNGILAHVDQLRAAGHTVEAIDFEYLDYIVPAYYILTTAEASSNLSRYDGVRYGYRTPGPVDDLTDFYKRNRSEGFGKEVKRRIMLGTFVLSTGYYDAYYSKAQQVRQLILDKTELIFKDFDILLLPTSPSTAFKFGEKSQDLIEMFLADVFTVYANLAGIPGLAYPIAKHSNGMPFGVQVMSNRFQELPLLQLANRSASTIL